MGKMSPSHYKHEKSGCHLEAVDIMIGIPKYWVMLLQRKMTTHCPVCSWLSGFLIDKVLL